MADTKYMLDHTTGVDTNYARLIILILNHVIENTPYIPYTATNTETKDIMDIMEERLGFNDFLFFFPIRPMIYFGSLSFRLAGAWKTSLVATLFLLKYSFNS